MKEWFGIVDPRRSIRGKLAASVLLTAVVVLLTTGIVTLIHDLSVYRRSWAADVATEANLLAITVAPALAFDDRATARRNLEALRGRSGVRAAGLYAADGSLYAQFAGDAEAGVPPRAPDFDGLRMQVSQVELVRPVEFNDEVVGHLYVEARYDLAGRVRAYLGIFSIIALLSMVAALLLSAVLQRLLTTPVEAIGAVAGRIVNERDYSLRVPDAGDDEIGLVVKALNRMLDEIEQRARDLNANITRLKQTEEALRDADRRKDEFLATLAHELRNPLAPIRHATRILDSPVASEQQRQWGRGVIARQVQHMALLLDDLLDVSRITRGRLELKREPVTLDKLISAAIETARPLVESRKHNLTVELPDAPVTLNVDPLRVSQALSNLLTNAAKYTDADGHIAIVARRVTKGVTIDVRDTGIGLQANAIPRVFEMFSQIESALERSQGGLGIGLALVRGVIALHGGTVAAASEGPGKGSTFSIHLPEEAVLDRAEEPAAGPGTPAAGPAQRPCRVLVVDDSHDAAESLGMILRLRGYAVDIAHLGAQALALAGEHHHDVYVLDIGMPEMSGYEVAERLRKTEWGRAALLLAMTGWGQESDKERARAAGFDQHFTKPVDPLAIERAIAEWCATPVRNRSGSSSPGLPDLQPSAQ